jgi:hypothetical protein
VGACSGLHVRHAAAASGRASGDRGYSSIRRSAAMWSALAVRPRESPPHGTGCTAIRAGPPPRPRRSPSAAARTSRTPPCSSSPPSPACAWASCRPCAGATSTSPTRSCSSRPVGRQAACRRRSRASGAPSHSPTNRPRALARLAERERFVARDDLVFGSAIAAPCTSSETASGTRARAHLVGDEVAAQAAWPCGPARRVSSNRGTSDKNQRRVGRNQVPSDPDPHHLRDVTRSRPTAVGPAIRSQRASDKMRLVW